MRRARDEKDNEIDAHDEAKMQRLLKEGHTFHCTCCDARVFYKPSHKVSPHFASYHLDDHDPSCLTLVESRLKEFQYHAQYHDKEGKSSTVHVSANTITINNRIFEDPAFYKHVPDLIHKKRIKPQTGERNPRIASASRFLEFIHANGENQTLGKITFKYRDKKYGITDLYYTQKDYEKLYTKGFRNNEADLPMMFIETKRYRGKYPYKTNRIECEPITVSSQKTECKYAIVLVVHFHDSKDLTSSAKDLKHRFFTNKHNIIWGKPHIEVENEKQEIKRTEASKEKAGRLYMHFNIYHASQFAAIPSKNEEVQQTQISFPSTMKPK